MDDFSKEVKKEDFQETLHQDIRNLFLSYIKIIEKQFQVDLSKDDPDNKNFPVYLHTAQIMTDFHLREISRLSNTYNYDLVSTTNNNLAQSNKILAEAIENLAKALNRKPQSLSMT